MGKYFPQKVQGPEVQASTIQTCVHTRTCTHTYTHAHAHMHTHMHIHMHTHILTGGWGRQAGRLCSVVLR